MVKILGEILGEDRVVPAPLVIDRKFSNGPIEGNGQADVFLWLGEKRDFPIAVQITLYGKNYYPGSRTVEEILKKKDLTLKQAYISGARGPIPLTMLAVNPASVRSWKGRWENDEKKGDVYEHIHDAEKYKAFQQAIFSMKNFFELQRSSHLNNRTLYALYTRAIEELGGAEKKNGKQKSKP